MRRPLKTKVTNSRNDRQHNLTNHRIRHPRHLIPNRSSIRRRHKHSTQRHRKRRSITSLIPRTNTIRTHNFRSLTKSLTRVNMRRPSSSQRIRRRRSSSSPTTHIRRTRITGRRVSQSRRTRHQRRLNKRRPRRRITNTPHKLRHRQPNHKSHRHRPRRNQSRHSHSQIRRITRVKQTFLRNNMVFRHPIRRRRLQQTNSNIHLNLRTNRGNPRSQGRSRTHSPPNRSHRNRLTHKNSNTNRKVDPTSTQSSTSKESQQY